MILGIDLGSTTTKIVLMEKQHIVEKHRIENDVDYIAFLQTMDLSAVEKIMVVGAGASFISEDILGIPTEHVPEFLAVGLGGHFLSDEDACMVVSLGTGTSFIYVNRDQRVHVGGTGMGGALLHSLSLRGLGMDDVNAFMALALKGDISRADLLIRDISKTDIGSLYGDVTAANMGKITDASAPEDYAIGVCNLVFQNVAVMAVMADRPYNTKKIVVMGAIGRSEIARQCFEMVGQLFGYTFILPEDAVYGVAIGAILHGDEDYNNKWSIYGQPMDEVDYMFE